MLVGMMVMETWIISILVEFSHNMQDGNLKSVALLKLLRLMRVFRMARLVRLVRAVPELMVLIKGMTMAARSVLLTILLLGIVIYVFAIGMTNLMHGTPVAEVYWHTVPESMKTLLLHGCFFEGLPDVVNETGRESLFYGAVVIVFVWLAAMTIMNMLVGVLVQVVSSVAAIEQEVSNCEYVKVKMIEALRVIGAENSENISREDFSKLLSLSKPTRALQDVGVDVVGLIDFTDFIFRDCDTISLQTFMCTVLQLRGTNMATVKDVVDLRKSIMMELVVMTELLPAAIGPAAAKKLSTIGSPTGDWGSSPEARMILRQSR